MSKRNSLRNTVLIRSLLCFALAAAASCDGDAPAAPPPDLDPPPGSTRLGVFEGKVPCDDCERVKVRLALHRGTQDGAPTAYVLERVEVGHGNERLISSGAWSQAIDGRVDPANPVATLAAAPDAYRHYLMIGSNLLLMLDDRLAPRVGNAVHSFTLSRTE